MTDSAWDEPNTQNAWLASQREAVEGYLRREGVKFRDLKATAQWFVAPYVALWQFTEAPDSHSWVISGDLPTDYISGPGITTARSAMAAFAKRWLEVATYMARGEAHPTIEIGGPETWPKLNDLLRRRSDTLQGWADDDDMWK